MHSRITRSTQGIIFIFITALFFATACNPEAGEGADTTSAQAGTPPAPDPGKVFDDSVKEDKCSLLTPAQVAAAASVPESAVEKNPAACLYEWEGANIYLSSVRVHDSVERASRYFARNTQDAIAEEIRASKEQLKDEMKESETGTAISEALIDAAPEDAVSHQRWDDIGSEAAWDGNSVMFRYGNVTVVFSGKTYDRTAGEDWVDPEIARDIARAIVSNLDKAG